MEEQLEQETPMTPPDEMMELLADLSEKYGIPEEDMNPIVDCFNECMGAPAEEEPVPEEAVEPEEDPEDLDD